MALTLIVEDGTGVSGANTYCSLAAANTYHAGRLWAEKWQEADIADQERALVMATKLLDQYCEWRGGRTVDREFPAWPRSGMYDRAGVLIDPASMPLCLVEATAELARRLIEDNRLARAEETAVSVSAGGRSRSYATRTAPVLPASVTRALTHLTVPSRLARVG